VSEEDYLKTEAVVAEFGRLGGVGEMLQKKLQQRSEVKESWVGLHVGGAPAVCVCVCVFIRVSIATYVCVLVN